ncbi:hypothetical protein [Shimia thalassica]|uniref:hypothetical protein n=1 Tax=Shimia thalassica TaxID=1715693 RepID=UPI0026E151B1|nr:hypothetical protein [Shimia thalassica]MDO6485637.1 hypothetical protein [Shimia thalassica]
MSDLFMSVTTGQNAAGSQHHCDALFSGFWFSKGKASVGQRHARRNEGILLKNGEQISFSGPKATDWIRFDITRDAPVDGALLASKIALPAQPENAACLLRLDQVTFPTGAAAYRHVHPGDGIRFLVNGELRVIADTHQDTAKVGNAWFEAANSPVRAEASTTQSQTSFVRFMVLPAAYVGQPTIRILDEAEAQLPRKQVTQRHIDELAYLSPG